MRVLLTGCNGQVGSYLTKKITKIENITLLALSKEQLDITDRDLVFKTVKNFQPTIIINSAAYTQVDKAEKFIELAYAVNRDGPMFLAQAAQEAKCLMFHISTDYVFDGCKNGEYLENDIPNPKSIYGKSKLAGEEAVQRECDKYIIIRTAWVFGEYGSNFVKTMLNLANHRKEIGVVNDQFGGPTFAGDIAHVILKICNRYSKDENIKKGIYHYSGFPFISWFEFSEIIFNQAEIHNILSVKPLLRKLTTAEFPTLAKRPYNSKLSNEKIKSIFFIESSNWLNAIKNIKSFME